MNRERGETEGERDAHTHAHRDRDTRMPYMYACIRVLFIGV